MDQAKRIIKELQEKYPGAKVFDLDGAGQHFVAEVEPSEDHPKYDRAIEVILKSKPHKHLKTTQKFTVIAGSLQLHVDDQVVTLNAGNSYTVPPGTVHWAESSEKNLVEIYSTPGWTEEDHHLVE